jgi:hypothetical protein
MFNQSNKFPKGRLAVIGIAEDLVHYGWDWLKLFNLFYNFFDSGHHVSCTVAVIRRTWYRRIRSKALVGQPAVMHFTDAVFESSHEPLLGRADELHFRVSFLDIDGDGHLFGAAGRIGGVLAHPLRRYLFRHKLEGRGNVVVGLESPDIDMP